MKGINNLHVSKFSKYFLIMHPFQSNTVSLIMKVSNTFVWENQNQALLRKSYSILCIFSCTGLTQKR